VGFLSEDGLYLLCHRRDGSIPAREHRGWSRQEWRERDRFDYGHRFYRSVHPAEEGAEIRCRRGHSLRIPTGRERRRMLERAAPGQPVYLAALRA
jgi:hypothetical protein